MRKIFLPLALLIAAPTVSACSTVQSGQVVIATDKAYVTAQAAFVSFQQAAIAGIKSGVIKGATKAKVIDLVDRGQVIENRLYATRNAADVIALTGIVSDLAKLTKGN